MVDFRLCHHRDIHVIVCLYVYDKIQAVYLLKPDNLCSRSLGNIPSYAGRNDSRKRVYVCICRLYQHLCILVG